MQEFKACNAVDIATPRKTICRFDDGDFYKSNLPQKQTLNILQKRIHEKYPNSKARTKPFSFAMSTESRRLVQAQASYRAYKWHQDVHNLPDNYAEDANSFCREGGNPGMFKKITVGTDCSGIEAPIMALNNMNISHKHLFSCDSDPMSKKLFSRTSSPSNITITSKTETPQVCHMSTSTLQDFRVNHLVMQVRSKDLKMTKAEVKYSTKSSNISNSNCRKYSSWRMSRASSKEITEQSLDES